MSVTTAEIDGLRQLADFLEAHPVGFPRLEWVTLYDAADVAGFCAGLDTPPVTREFTGEHGWYVEMSRWFGGVELRGFCRADLVGHVIEREETTVSFTLEPFTVDEIRRAADAGTEPECDPMPAPSEIVTAP